MSKKVSLKPVAAALGTTFAVSLAISPLANAAENPFNMTELSNGGYMIAEGNCGEKKEAEGKCGESKSEEGKCGENKDQSMSEEGKKKEGKCGEAKCGNNKGE